MPRIVDGIRPDLARRLGIGRQNVEQDALDARIWQDIRNASAALSDLARQNPEPPWESLLQDIYAQYYKLSPRLRPSEQVDPQYQVNRPFLERIMEDPQTGITRVSTSCDEVVSALATLQAGRALAQEIRDRKPLAEALHMANRAQELENQGRTQEAQGIADAAMQTLRQAARDVRQAVRTALAAGQQEAQDVQQVMAGWGVGGDELRSVPMGDRLQLVERLRGPKMRKLADIIGRFRNLARERQKNRLQHVRDEIHSITTGDDLAHLLPSELAALRHPLRRRDFLRRYTEKRTMQYELTGRQPLGRGPMVVCVDCSGSMEESGRIDWALATALALVDTARRQKRRARILMFHDYVLKRIEFRPGQDDPRKLLELLTTGASGGTNYEPVLREALEAVESVSYQKADVVMISDGACQVSEAFAQSFAEAKRERRFRLWSVLIGTDDSYGALTRLSDRVWPHARLTEEVAGELFEGVYD